jgi:glycerol dehydrogenase
MAYIPETMFGIKTGPNETIPRAMISPARYIQGVGVLDHLGRYLELVPGKNVAILISENGQKRFGERIRASLKNAKVRFVIGQFGGECSIEEVTKHEKAFGLSNELDCLIAVGGGKCIDAGKCIAVGLRIPAVIVPTLASNDAPCSALSIMYSPDGVMSGVEFFKQSPALVLVDTRIVANSPERYFVAGMGDALATWYEAHACGTNKGGRTCVGGRPTLAAGAIAESCAATLFADGEAAVSAVRKSEVNDVLERVVEANTLLSGIGFESGGLACAHSIAQALTLVPSVHSDSLHGEMVGIGLLTQLLLEKRQDELQKVARFMALIGLPVNFQQISFNASDREHVNQVIDFAMNFPFMPNEPFPVTREALLQSFMSVDEFGSQIKRQIGDSAFLNLRAENRLRL